MSVPTKMWIYVCVAICLFLTGFGYGNHVASVEAKVVAQKLELSQAGDANKAWAERFALQSQLATRDKQLADSQAESAQKRTEIVIKKEIVYRDKIKDVVVRDCVANSGLLDLYDATLGLSNPTE